MQKKSTAAACIIFIPSNYDTAAARVLGIQSGQKLKQMKENTKDSCKNDCEEVVSGGVRRDKLKVFVCLLLKTF